MKVRLLFLAGVVLGSGLYVMVQLTAPHPAKSTTNGKVEEIVPVLENDCPIGWVFGRLVGVPGAERPLMSSFGPAQRVAPPPPISEGRP